jgi:hypothetical protein
MTEAEWTASDNLARLWEFLHPRISERKKRLFIVAICRRVWPLLEDERSIRAIDVGERYADGDAPREELDGAEAEAFAATDAAMAGPLAVSEATDAVYVTVAGLIPCKMTITAAVAAANAVTASAPPEAEMEARTAEMAAQVALLRCVVGNPFRPAPLGDCCRTPTAVWLARAVYEERLLPYGQLDPARLAVLADALEEAAADDEVIAHLRGPGPHVRGCFVLDALLGNG